MRILIAEDNEDLLNMLIQLCEHQGWDVTGAKDGREALRFYHNGIAGDRYFDVLLLDVEMPRLNGFGVGVNVRNLEKFSDVPRGIHIYLTGHDDVVPPEQLLDIHFADGYIRKPFEAEDLIAQIEKLVSEEAVEAP